ncbi:MAG: hypothetical protein JW852_08145, partial [Spirochaetales bacterium]|nr:hypothetical protein [Spirochaetales bacterium]
MAALSLLALAPAVILSGQYLTDEEEAPEALLDVQLGSAEVELFVDGSWEATVGGSVGFGFRRDTSPFIARYPGMFQGRPFSQEPDLLLSLWIEQRYFFETSILAGYDLNSLRLGYVNPEDGFLRQVILGTPAPPVHSYGDMLFSEGGKGSFGISVETATESSRHDAVLRIEDFGLKSKRYIGSKEVVETAIALDGYIRGRFFVLPDDDVDFIEVYVEREPDT